MRPQLLLVNFVIDVDHDTGLEGRRLMIADAQDQPMSSRYKLILALRGLLYGCG